MGNDLVERQAAIDALDGNVIVTSRESAQAVMDYIRGCADRMRSLPSAQPELIEKAAYIRGFEQGRTQGMIDTKAEEVAQTNLQPTCNQLATDTISRQAAIDALGDKPLAWTEGEYELGLQNQWQSDVDALKALPSAQPERKTGKWNRRKGMYEIGFKCSECNTFSIAETPYCSFCGSHMVQEGEDNE